MRAFGERVDDRYAGHGRQLDDVGVPVHARDYTIDVAVQHTCGVAQRFPDPELDVVLAQSYSPSAEAGDSDLEGDAGAMRGLLEEQRQEPALERLLAPLSLLD